MSLSSKEFNLMLRMILGYLEDGKTEELAAIIRKNLTDVENNPEEDEEE